MTIAEERHRDNVLCGCGSRTCAHLVRVISPGSSPFGPLDEHGHDGHAPQLNGLLADCPGCVTPPELSVS